MINPAAGRAGPRAAEEMRALFDELGVEADICAPSPAELSDKLTEIIKEKPDILVVLAGDGTARAAAEMAGPKGPLVVPLPGGTMNMLPKALYGESDWRTALREALSDGVERHVGGGEIDGHTFYCAAMLGSTALFAPAREAAREGRVRDALLKVRDAYRKAFSGRIRFMLDDKGEQRALALTLICPMISKALEGEEPYMEVAALHPDTPGDAARLGARVVLSRIVGDWRRDPAVDVGRCRKGRAWSRGPIPALLDGESVRIGRHAEFRFRPRAFRALAPPTEEDEKI